MRKVLAVFALLAMVASYSLTAQPAQKYVRVLVAPERADWTYKSGEKAKFNVSVTKNDIAFQDAEVRYELSEDMMEPFKTGTAQLKKGTLTIDAGTLKKAGFLRCRVFTEYDGVNYEGIATAAFDPLKIEPTIKLPNDFMEFWNNAKKENEKIPMEPIVTLMPERCTGSVNVYQVSIQNLRYGSRVYGILSVPKAEGKYPAMFYVPGAGLGPRNGQINDAARGFITFEIGIHGIPVDMPHSYYRALDAGALHDYPRIKYNNKHEYYYKRVYLGCVRAIDFIESLPEYNGDLTVQGGSQGGALSIVTAALDDRVDRLVALFPALCDLTGYLNNRAGGWPHLFRGKHEKATPEILETLPYYDVVNFARQLNVPGFYSLGFNDMVCPPTSMFSAYNTITAPKELMVVEELGHFIYPEQWGKIWEWINSQVVK